MQVNSMVNSMVRIKGDATQGDGSVVLRPPVLRPPVFLPDVFDVSVEVW